MVKKLRVSLALQPIATALFASSPFTEGRPNGFKSMRSEVWRDTDPNRTGLLPFVFETGMGFERYVDYALDVPMYFVYRDGNYIDVAGASFRDFMAGKLVAMPGELPTAGRLVRSPDHSFPRGAHEALPGDARRRRRALAPHLRAAGVLDGAALRRRGARCSLGSRQALDARTSAQELRNGVPKMGLATPFRGTTAQEIARQAVRIARTGLRNRRRINARSQDETVYLGPLDNVVATGKTVADELLERYTGSWGRNIDHVFEEFAF